MSQTVGTGRIALKLGRALLTRMGQPLTLSQETVVVLSESMTPDEKERLLSTLQVEDAWCQDAEARDEQGEPVCYDDNRAVAWDLTGAVCRLFGWDRACLLFPQLDRHIHGGIEAGTHDDASTRAPELASMAALQEYNDRRETTHAAIVEALRSMPVRSGPTEEAN